MKIPLLYQRTEYDCGPTSLLNAISFLFNLEDIPPDILRYVMMYTLDRYNEKGEACKNGTSQMAMLFLSNWLNQYAKAKRLGLICEYLSGAQVKITENSKTADTLRQGGAAVIRLFDECWHYVTLTGVVSNSVNMFDPFYREEPYGEAGIEMIADKPHIMNRRVTFDVLNRMGKQTYSLGPIESREAVLLYNANTYETSEDTIEYYL
ncbi:MAG: peptidase C39 [Clostridiales bacterium]|jgi:hypothetical protein|nr:peptidase C39 [Clostridiales bacterium]